MNAPQLLRTVEFDSTVDSAAAADDYLLLAQSFACWAVRHAAGAVRRLSLRIGTFKRSKDEPEVIWHSMMRVLAACGAAGSLQEAQLYIEYCFGSLPASLPVALRGVRRLDVEVEEGELVVDVPLAAMTALAHLRLEASPGAGHGGLHFTSAASLPTSLTRLHLGGTCWLEPPPRDLPLQVTSMRQHAL